MIVKHVFFGDADPHIDNGSVIYKTGSWDIVTVMAYAFIIILCFNSFCFALQVRFTTIATMFILVQCI